MQNSDLTEHVKKPPCMPPPGPLCFSQVMDNLNSNDLGNGN